MLTPALEPAASIEARAPQLLRVAVIVDGFEVPAWAARLLKELKAGQLGELVLVIRLSAEGYENGHEALLYRVYRTLDNKFFPLASDAFAPVNIFSIVPDCPMVPVTVRRQDGIDLLKESDLNTIKKYHLDVALQLSSLPLKLTPEIARDGIWSHQIGEIALGRTGADGFWNVLEDNPITSSALITRPPDSDRSVVLDCAYAATDKRSVRRNANNVAWKAPALIRRAMRQLQISGDSRKLGNRTATQCLDRDDGPPHNIQMSKLLMRHGWRYISERWHYLHYSDRWILYYRIAENGSNGLHDLSQQNYQRILPPRGRQYADPFCLQRADRYYIFFEELLEDKDKGVISLITMDTEGKYDGPHSVLERDYHLSYPFVFTHDGTYYMVPESAANRTVELYRCTSWPDRWELESVLMENLAAADATLERIDGTYWMFLTIPSIEEARACDELHLFSAPRPSGPWVPHPDNPVKTDVRSARPAGRLFRHNERLYRPAQDCSRRYGWAISINEVERITRSEYREREVYRILPDWDPEVLATHTLNRTGRLTVTDGRVSSRR
jgi:hypothetical protein